MSDGKREIIAKLIGGIKIHVLNKDTEFFILFFFHFFRNIAHLHGSVKNSLTQLWTDIACTV